MAVQESQLQKDKIRVYVLARELNIDTKELLDLCKQAGLDVKNQLSSIDPDQKDMIEQLVKKGAHKAPVAAVKAVTGSALPDVNKPIRNLDTRPVRREAEPPRVAPKAPEAPPAVPVPSAKPPEPAVPATPAAQAPPTARPATPPPPAGAAPPPKPTEAKTEPKPTPPGTPPLPEVPGQKVRDLDGQRGGSPPP